MPTIVLVLESLARALDLDDIAVFIVERYDKVPANRIGHAMDTVDSTLPSVVTRRSKIEFHVLILHEA